MTFHIQQHVSALQTSCKKAVRRSLGLKMMRRYPQQEKNTAEIRPVLTTSQGRFFRL